MKTFPTFRRGAATSLLLIATGLVPFSASAKNSRAKPPQLISMFAKDNIAQEITADALSATPDAWQNIQYHSYDKRQEFNAVFARMLAKLDADIRVLNEKRATMKNDPRAWDFAMKELNNARADVQSKVTDLSRANTADTWTSARDRLGIAWDRAQTAVEAVRNSTTS